MASELKIYSLYRDKFSDKYYLLRTLRPGFSNADQHQENTAIDLELKMREHMLRLLVKENPGINNASLMEYIGEQQGFPVGDLLYQDNANFELDIFYMHTAFGNPWIIVGTANNEAELLAELTNDEELAQLKPVGRPVGIVARFITGNDLNY